MDNMQVYVLSFENRRVDLKILIELTKTILNENCWLILLLQKICLFMCNVKQISHTQLRTKYKDILMTFRTFFFSKTI